MSSGVNKGRGRPFQPGNPGRPRGSKNKVTQIIEELAAGQAEQVIREVFRLGLAGNVFCLKIAADRIWPPRKAPAINVTMPPINSAQDVLAALASICKALGEGQLNPDETTALCSVLGSSTQVFEHQELERRIAALEEARDKRDEKKHSTTG